MSEDLQKIKSLIILTSAYYAHPIGNEVVQMYAEDLVDLGFENVKQALIDLRKDPSIVRFPLPAKIRAKLCPALEDRQIALDVAKRMTAAVVRRGYTWSWPGGYQPHESFEAAVKAELGELAWEVIRRRGGWQRVHDEFFECDEGVFTAQLRDHIESVSKMAKAGTLGVLPALPESKNSSSNQITGPTSAKEISEGLISKLEMSKK